MKLDHIAYYVHNQIQEMVLKKALGLTDESQWVEDKPVMKVWDGYGNPMGELEARLLFNNSLGIEIEIMTYIKGWHIHKTNFAFRNHEVFISHFGHYLNDDEEFPDRGLPLVQSMMSISHTNPAAVSKKRQYFDRMYRAPGAILKYTKRMK